MVFVLVFSVGCGKTKDAVSPNVYALLEEALVAKNKAERDLRMYTNLVRIIIDCFCPAYFQICDSVI